MVIAACVVAWLVMRVVFFVGLTGSDDLRYVRYAALWDRAPVNSWEAHTLGNALTALSMAVFGRGEVASAVPSMVASLATLVCVLYWCFRRGCARYAYWAGMLVAVLPLDVQMATTVSPHSIMVGFMSVGTLLLVLGSGARRGRVLAAAALSLGFVTHLAGGYYLVALFTAALCVDHRRYLPTVLLALVACALGLLVEMSVLYATFGEPLARFHAVLAETAHPAAMVPRLPDGSLNVEFLLWPIRSLFFSKAFGIALAVVMFVGLLRVQGLDAPDRILVLTTVLFWLWVSVGSVLPWRYVPFERISQFLQPLTLALAVLFAVVVASRRHWWASTTGASCVVAICVANLMSSGTWGQNASVSAELLSYVHAHPHTRFLADYRTANELYILNGVQPVEGVAVLADGHTSRLLEPATRVVQPAAAAELVDEILVNTLNVKSSPEFAAFLDRRGGDVTFKTRPKYRAIAILFRPLMDHSWAVRKPPAIVRACRALSGDRVAVSRE